LKKGPTVARKRKGTILTVEGGKNQGRGKHIFLGGKKKTLKIPFTSKGNQSHHRNGSLSKDLCHLFLGEKRNCSQDKGGKVNDYESTTNGAKRDPRLRRETGGKRIKGGKGKRHLTRKTGMIILKERRKEEKCGWIL